ncbi:MAG TPA: hypothetical protein DHV62_04045, partial [Elusimicrobia bacterium]|nr:hypothetical protein [Elusimicrobiota bacterium]
AGVDGGYHNDLWYYLYRGSGTYISPALSVSFSTSLTWDSFEVFPKAQKGELRFQFASSSDNKSWTKFVGPNGEENTYYSYNYVGKIWDGHKDQSYFKFKAYFQSNSLFESPELDAITIFYNCSPTMPTPVYPYPGANINRSSFTWKNADDEDNLDVLTYEIRLGSAPVPASGDIYITGIPQSLTQYSSTEPVTVISEGKWYWQIRAYDGTTYGDWSESYVFFLDTTPPTTVNDLTASIGPANGTVELTWTNTGDDGIIGDISNGGYLVKWSSSGRIAEGDWEIIVDSVTWTEILITLGSKRTKIISNLQNATTYYFSLRIIDDAGNLSPLSNSTSAFTNVPPEVTLLSPNQGEYGNTNLSTSSLNISWTYSDSNPGDTHNFAIYLSTDNETSYTILVVSGLTDKTTFYLWDSRQAPNGSSNRIKVIATDKRGLEGWDISDSAFTISNLNERPEIHIIYPINNEIISGTTYFHWSYSDPNRSDKHQFQIYLSSNVGLTWKEIGRVLNQEYYLFDSTSEPNRINYLLKVKIEDIISPPMNPLSNEDTSNFGISNYNLAPGTFSLISPPSGRLYPSLPLFFEWEEAIDPNGDEVTYTLYYSTDKNFGASVAVNTSKNNFCRLLFFDEEKIYYWYVEAKDQFGASRLSNEIGNFFTISRKRVKIDNLEVEVSTGLPDNTYLRVDKISSGEYLPLSWANQHSINDPTTRKIDDFAYRVGIYDTSDKLISPSGIKLKILYGCQDINGYFKGTNIPVDNLRICRLEEKVSSAFWTPAVYPQEVDQGKKNVSVSIEYSDSFPGIIISLLGYAPVVAYLSQVANYPNPFNPTKGEKKTRIEYYLTEDSNVTIRIYNLVGDLVWTKENAAGVGTPEGYRNIEFWDGKNDAGMIVANGVYLCLITARPADSAGGEERKISRLIGVVK